MLGQDGRTLLQAHQLIEKRFVGEYDPAENLSATLETMVDSLGDRWSYYLDPAEAQRTREARSNAYVGIGVTVSQEPSDGLEIVGVTAGSPAQEAGLQVGEIIRAVDGQAIQPETREEAVEAIKGEEGTWLTLEVEAADGTRRTVELQRKQVHGMITAAWKLLEDQVGLVTIQNFYAGTADLVKQGVAELQAQGARALVFDVRNNPGGYVTELTEINFSQIDTDINKVNRIKHTASATLKWISCKQVRGFGFSSPLVTAAADNSSATFSADIIIGT